MTKNKKYTSVKNSYSHGYNSYYAARDIRYLNVIRNYIN